MNYLFIHINLFTIDNSARLTAVILGGIRKLKPPQPHIKNGLQNKRPKLLAQTRSARGKATISRATDGNIPGQRACLPTSGLSLKLFFPIQILAKLSTKFVGNFWVFVSRGSRSKQVQRETGCKSRSATEKESVVERGNHSCAALIPIFKAVKLWANAYEC